MAGGVVLRVTAGGFARPAVSGVSTEDVTVATTGAGVDGGLDVRRG
jgi:hypothetical protein